MDNVSKLNEAVAGTVLASYETIEFGKVLDGSNSLYEIRPTLVYGVSGKPYATYGIFNAGTGVMETDSRQLPAAKEWVQALSAMLKGQPIPQLNSVHPMSEEDDEEEGEQQELPLH